MRRRPTSPDSERFLPAFGSQQTKPTHHKKIF
jgi:hypothetical protein